MVGEMNAILRDRAESEIMLIGHIQMRSIALAHVENGLIVHGTAVCSVVDTTVCC